MDETKPPPTCGHCGKPIWPGDDVVLGTRDYEDEGGETVTEAAPFHAGCWAEVEAAQAGRG